MLIPKQVTIGKTTYQILSPYKMDSQLSVGRIHYSVWIIEIAQRSADTGKLRTPKQRAQTFWHEVTHGILKDMGHRLESNEVFVDAFATRLVGVIQTAKF